MVRTTWHGAAGPIPPVLKRHWRRSKRRWTPRDLGVSCWTPSRYRLVELVEEYGPIEVIVGLPRSLDGGEGPSAARIRGYAVSFARAVSPIPVRFVDERLTTVTAANALRASGRSARHQRSVIDQVAAVTILEYALETERQTGAPPGHLVTAEELT